MGMLLKDACQSKQVTWALTFLKESKSMKPFALCIIQSLTHGSRAQPLRFPINNCNYPISLLKGSTTRNLWKDYLSESVLHVTVLVMVSKRESSAVPKMCLKVWHRALATQKHRRGTIPKDLPPYPIYTKKTYIPTSQIISWVAGDSKSFARTWNECKSVSDS